MTQYDSLIDAQESDLEQWLCHVSAVACMGVLQVATASRTTLAQAIEALLIAELTDEAGWDMLIEMVDSFGIDKLRDVFLLAQRQQNEHLKRARVAARLRSAP